LKQNKPPSPSKALIWSTKEIFFKIDVGLTFPQLIKEVFLSNRHWLLIYFNDELIYAA